MRDLLRSSISIVLDRCSVPSDDREDYYRFILRLADVDSREQLEREIEGFVTKGCEEKVLRKLVELHLNGYRL